MKWVIEHLQVIIAVAAAIAYWLNQRRQAAAEDQPASPRQASDAAEQAERTRHVQEEIRRKIAERRGEAVGPAPATPAPRERIPRMVPPLRVPPLEPFGGPMHRRSAPPAPPAVVIDEAAERAALARQARLAEQMRALEAARQEEQRRAAEIAARPRAEPVAVEAPTVGMDWRESLRDPRELRRAIVLREILGAPVGLR